MAKPAILTVDDDPEVRQAIARDLRKEYGDRFRILRVDSGLAALEVLQQLKLRNEPVALFVVDQRMPKLTGVEFLEQAKEYAPRAKRTLLTAYADTEAAIRAINRANIDYYLTKPWDPPEVNLYPILNDFLEDWQSTYRPPFEGLRLIGHQWSPQSHQIRDFLARNHIPYQWLDVEAEEANRLVTLANADVTQLPLLLFPDGSQVTAPSPVQIAEKIGLKTRPTMPFYKLAIVGAGPAGLAAAVYGTSEGLSTVLIERQAPGGQAGTSSRIENYLGFPVGLTGGDLARRAVAQAQKFGTEILTPQEATQVRVEGQYRFITLADGTELSCHALIVATGVAYVKLNVPGIERLAGAGVYYGAAMTEALSCRDQAVYVVGGANSAGQAAMYLSQYARAVTLLVRGESLAKSMSQYLIDQIAATDNILVQTHTQVKEALGQEKLEAVSIVNSQTNQVDTVPASALFIFIGAKPRTDWLQGVVERDERGFILTGVDLMKEQKPPQGWTLEREPYLLEASVPGIFAVGDVRHQSVKRVASAVGEGSIAVQFIHRYLASL